MMIAITQQLLSYLLVKILTSIRFEVFVVVENVYSGTLDYDMVQTVPNFWNSGAFIFYLEGEDSRFLNTVGNHLRVYTLSLEYHSLYHVYFFIASFFTIFLQIFIKLLWDIKCKECTINCRSAFYLCLVHMLQEVWYLCLSI